MTFAHYAQQQELEKFAVERPQGVYCCVIVSKSNMLNSLNLHVLHVVPVGARVNYSTFVVLPSHRH